MKLYICISNKEKQLHLDSPKTHAHTAACTECQKHCEAAFKPQACRHTHPTLHSKLLCSLSLSCYRFPCSVVCSCCFLQVTSFQPFYKSHDNHIGLTNATLLNNNNSNNNDDDDDLKRGNII